MGKRKSKVERKRKKERKREGKRKEGVEVGRGGEETKNERDRRVCNTSQIFFFCNNAKPCATITLIIRLYDHLFNRNILLTLFLVE